MPTAQKKAVDVVGGGVQHGLDLGELAAAQAGDDAGLLGDLGEAGWAKMARIVAATISAEPRGTWARTLRRKWMLCRRRHNAHWCAVRRLAGVTGHFSRYEHG